MISWFVAHTQPMKETVAQKHLIEQGFSVYLPRFKKIRRHARKVDEVLAPLFPRYLFVGLDFDTDPWRSVNGTRGVSYLLTGSDDRPLQVGETTIHHLRSQETSDGLVSVSSLSLFVEGEKVRVIEGAFEGQIATVDMMDDKQRVQVLLTFLSREMKITLPVYAVEAA